jgi:hypothetical protein
MNRRDIHPAWCGQDHVCSHDRPGGEHRSYPYTVDTLHARFVITRIRTRTGVDRLELRAVVDLPIDQVAARHYTVTMLGRVYHAINARSSWRRR